MKLELIIDKTVYEEREIKVKLGDRVISYNSLTAFDDVDCDTFSEVIDEIRKACINICRADISIALRYDVEEDMDCRFDEYDSYVCEYTNYEFRDGNVFSVVTGDYDLYKNTEYRDLVNFLNKNLLVYLDTEIILTVKE